MSAIYDVTLRQEVLGEYVASIYADALGKNFKFDSAGIKSRILLSKTLDELSVIEKPLLSQKREINNLKECEQPIEKSVEVY